MDCRRQEGETCGGPAGCSLSSFLRVSPPHRPLPAPGCSSTAWALRPAGTSETCCCTTSAKSRPCGQCPGMGLGDGAGGRLWLSGGQLRSRVCLARAHPQCGEEGGLWPRPAPQAQDEERPVGAKGASPAAEISLGQWRGRANTQAGCLVTATSVLPGLSLYLTGMAIMRGHQHVLPKC